MIKGLRTVIYNVDDIEKAKEWYSSILGFKPYFDQPFYVGFNVGGYELGLDPNASDKSKGKNVAAYWGVDNILKSLEHLIKLGAKKNSDIQDVGEGIKVASVLDPFGNILGIIENPNFKVEE
jgi:predicted enzyme related to lactoylglutathione lyase